MAHDGKEVEEITKKEIHKSLRGRVSVEQIKLEFGKDSERIERPQLYEPRRPQPSYPQQAQQGHAPATAYPRPQQPRMFTPTTPPPRVVKKEATDNEKKVLKEMLEKLVGSRGAQILDDKLNILGKVPVSELQTTIKSLTSGVYAVVFDGIIDRDLVKTAEGININFLIGMDSRIKQNETNIQLLTVSGL